MHGVLLAPLPYPDSGRLVALGDNVSALELSDLRDGTRTFAAMGGASPMAFDLTGDGEPKKLEGALVAGGMFEALGARAALGRPLAGTDDVLGSLDDYPTRSGYLIAPVVVWLTGVTVTPNPAEVAAAYRIAYRELFHDGSPEIVAIEESDRPIIRLPLTVAKVNAPTAAVLYQFREVALAGRDTRVDHFEQPVFAWR